MSPPVSKNSPNPTKFLKKNENRVRNAFLGPTPFWNWSGRKVRHLRDHSPRNALEFIM